MCGIDASVWMFVIVKAKNHCAYLNIMRIFSHDCTVFIIEILFCLLGLTGLICHIIPGGHGYGR